MEEMTTTDVRTDAQKTQMADAWTEYEAEYRTGHSDYEVVYEDDEAVIVADFDARGDELDHWADEFGVSRDALRDEFRAVADDKMGTQDAHEAASYSDLIVFVKDY